MKTSSNPYSQTLAHFLRAGSLAAALAVEASAQTPSAASASSQASAPGSADSTGETIVMSPFDVKSTRDTDYRVTNSKTATGISLELVRIPLNIQVVTSEFAEDQSIVSMHQALRYTSGLVIDEFNRDASGVRVRGFQQDGFYRNGIQRRTGVYMDNLDRIEVVKGPVSAFFAQSNPGGIVNYITKVPEFTTGATLRTVLGSFDYKYTNFDFQGVMPGYDKLAYRLITSYQDSNDWRDYEYVHRKYVSPEIRWRPNRLIDLTLSYEWVESDENLLNNGRTATEYLADYKNPPQDVINHFRQTGQTDQQVIDFLRSRWIGPNLTQQGISRWQADIGAVRGLLPPTITTGNLSSLYPSGRRYNTGGPGANKYFKTWQVEADLKMHLADWLDVRYDYNYYQGYVDQYQPFAFPNGDGTIPVQQRTNVSWTYNDVHSLDVFLKKEYWNINHRFVFGGQVTDSHTTTATRRMDFSSLGPVAHGSTILTGQAVANFYNPFTDPVIDVSQLIKEINPTRGHSGSIVKSVYATYQGTAFNDRLSTLIGVRRDSTKGSPSGTAPTYGVSYEFRPGFVGFVSRSENFRINGQNITGPGALASEIITNLPPETAVGVDIGIKTNWRNNTLSGALTYYTLENANERRTDRLRSDADPRNNDGTTANNITWFNIGGVERNEGLELDVVWAPKRNYVATLGYSWVWEGKIVADPSLKPGTQEYNRQIGRRLGNLPVHQVKIWNKYTFTEGALKNFAIGGGYRYIGPTDSQFTQYIFDYPNPSYQIFDLYLGYSGMIFDRKATTWISVQNLMNHIYLQGLNNDFADPRKIFFNVKLEF